MDSHGETENGRLPIFHLLPSFGPVVGAEDPVMMLGPKHVRIRSALNQAVGILNIRVEGPFWWNVGSPHAVTTAFPVFSRIVTVPDPTARDADPELSRIIGMDADRMDAGEVISSPKPRASFWSIPQASDQFPMVTVICGSKESAGDGAAPGRSVAAPLQAPNQFE